MVSAIAALLVWQQFDAATLRAELVTLRESGRELAQLRAENARLRQQQLPAAEIKRLRADQAALAALQRELEAVRARARLDNIEPAAGPANSGGETAGVKSERLRVEAMRDAGRATPQAAGETFIWALHRGDVDAAARLVVFSPVARARMEGLVAALPPRFRADYGTPERLLAFAMAGGQPIAAREVIDEAEHDDGIVVQKLKVVTHEGRVRTDVVHFQRDGGGWRRLILPATAEQVAAFLAAAPTAK